MIDFLERALICAALACAPRTDALAVGVQYVHAADTLVQQERRWRWLEEVSRWP